MHYSAIKNGLLFLIFLSVLVLSFAILDQRAPIAFAGKFPANGAQTVFIPLVSTSQTISTPSSAARRVHAPTYPAEIWWGGTGIFWFGKITPSENYADVRVAHNATDLFIRVTVFDRRIWCNTNAGETDPTAWDTVALALDVNGNRSAAPDTNDYRLIAPFSAGVGCVDGNWTRAYRGTGATWSPASIAFSSDSWYRGLGGPNQNADNEGWVITFQIPFGSLGLASAPNPGTAWGLGVTLYDRDSATNTFIPSKAWPETFTPNQPDAWGEMVFGLPSAYVAPPATPRATITIKQGLNGATVPDADVGAWTTCGAGLDLWTQWGEKNYAGQTQVNIQNQEDVSDWPCFSKYYVTFPLTALPAGKKIISSTLTLYQFGNSGQGWTPPPFRSLIQVMTVNDNWNEATLNWNNAPLAGELISQSNVDPLDTIPPWPGIPRAWDVSAAVARAYASGAPLRLVLYSADRPMHSGKYFYSSDASPEGRPTLQVLWGE
jgi:hypothetical protein